MNGMIFTPSPTRYLSLDKWYERWDIWVIISIMSIFIFYCCYFYWYCKRSLRELPAYEEAYWKKRKIQDKIEREQERKEQMLYSLYIEEEIRKQIEKNKMKKREEAEKVSKEILENIIEKIFDNSQSPPKRIIPVVII